MLRPLLQAIGALLLLAGLVAFLTLGGDSPPSPGSGDVAGGGETRSELRETALADGADQAAARTGAVTPRTDAERTEVEPDTVLTGEFQAPTGGWPGGGVAILVPRAEPPEGGMMGLFSAGMELAREGEASGRSERGRQLEQSVGAWLGRATPVATVAVDPRGRFEFRNPPAGSWSIELRHDSLRHVAPAPATVVEGERHDAGLIETELAASVLIVVSDVDAVPIPGAQVKLAREFDRTKFMDPNALRDIGGLIRGLIPYEAESDADGRCVIQGLDHTVAWNVSVEKRDFVAAHRELRVAPGTRTITRIELERGARIHLTVRDPDGAPYERARLRLVYPDLIQPGVGSVQIQMGAGGGAGDPSQPVSFNLETGTDGVAERAGLPAGRAELRVVTPGFLRAQHDLAIPVVGVVEHAIVLDRGATVAGVVLDEGGAPIEGAHVLSMAALGQSVMGLELESIVGLDLLTIGAEDRGVETDASGRFVMGGFEPDGGDVHLAAVATGYDPASVDAEVGDRDAEFRLLRACTVSGHVVDDATDEPVTAFRVSLQQRAFLVMDRPVVRREFEGRADGSFEVMPAPRQGFELVVEAEGYATTSTNVDLTGGSLDCGIVRLKLPAVIEGQTVDPDGLPLAGVKVRASKGGPADSLFLAELLGATWVESDAEGQFRIDGLTGRAVRLLADAEGFAPLRTKAIRIESGETVRGVLLELTRGGSIRAHVLDAERRPLVGWHVQAEHAGGSGHAFGRTDDQGVAVLEGLAGGTFKVTGLPPDYMERNQWRPSDPSEFGDFDLGALIAQAAEMAVEDRVVVRDGEESEVTLVHDGLEAGPVETLATVDGDVRVGGAPLRTGMVALYASGATMPRHLGDVSAGRFHFERVRPGTYRLQVRSGLLSGDLGRPSIVVIPSQPTHSLHVELPGGAIAGRVVDAESGEPVAGALLMLSRPGGTGGAGSERMDVGEGAALTDGSGAFRFDGLDAGVYDVFAKQWMLGAGGGRSGRLSTVAVGPGEVRDGLELTLGRGGTVQVRVRDASGSRANALVTLLGPHGDPLDLFHRALTDREGIAEFSGVPDGVYRASVDAPRAAPAVSDAIELRGGGATIDVVVRTGVPVTLSLAGEVPESWRGELLMYSVWREDGALLRSGRVAVPPPGALEAAARRGISVGSYSPGTYRLRVEGGRLGVLDETRHVPAADEASWTIDVDALRRR